jgi:hypothetical protein
MVGLSDPGQPFAARTFRRFARYLVLIGTKSLKRIRGLKGICRSHPRFVFIPSRFVSALRAIAKLKT